MSELAGMRESNEESSYREEALDRETRIGACGSWSQNGAVENA